MSVEYEEWIVKCGVGSGKSVEFGVWSRVFQITQYSFYRSHLLEFTVSWGKEAPYQK